MNSFHYSPSIEKYREVNRHKLRNTFHLKINRAEQFTYIWGEGVKGYFDILYEVGVFLKKILKISVSLSSIPARPLKRTNGEGIPVII